MDIRDWMNNNSAVVTIAAVLLLIAALFLLMKNCQGPGPTQNITSNYYYDMNTKQTFVGKADLIAPISTPSGTYKPAPDAPEMGAGVKAYVFACGDCSDPKKHFIGYLEMYTPEAKKKMEQFMEQAAQREGGAQMSPESYLMYEEGQVQGRMIMRVGDTEWVPAESDLGAKIVNELTSKCPKADKENRLRPCFPTGDQ
jgi:hypothetical protein